MNVLVTGGTGVLGRHVVMLLRQSGHRARIFSRNPRGHVDAVQGDLRTGQGLDRALAGMDSIVHAATGARESLRSRSDIRATTRLIDAAARAGIKHFVFTSIVGADRSSYPYHVTKLEAEAVVRGGSVPWSIVRATQFHDLIDILLRRSSRMPGVIMLPFASQLQPVDAQEVAARVVEVVLGPPGGLLDDFGGPEVKDLRSLADSWLAARQEHRRLVNMPLPFRFREQWAAGNLTAPEHRNGKITFDEYLVERYPQT